MPEASPVGWPAEFLECLAEAAEEQEALLPHVSPGEAESC